MNYQDIKIEEYTKKLIDNHPLRTDIIVKAVLKSWEDLFTTTLGSSTIPFFDLNLSPQVIGNFLHTLIPHHISLLDSNWRAESNKEDKDLVYIPDNQFSIEIKTSSNKNQIFGNRSYAQPPTGTSHKSKDGYYIAVNFEKNTDDGLSIPKIRLIRFGYLTHEDWIPQKSPTGQQARLTPTANKFKLITIYQNK